MKRLAILFCVLCACGEDGGDPARDLAQALVEACPVVDTSDMAARDACAAQLGELGLLRERLTAPMLWGGQPAGAGPEDLLYDAHLTEFDPYVWRRMYLSTFMFEDRAPVIERAGDYRVLRVPVRFRNAMDAGEYPYPFWHSPNKWTSYERALDLVFVFDSKHQIPVVVRGAEQDATRPHSDRAFDGMWTWDGGAEPRVALYSYLFDAKNPHVGDLDRAYRALEEGLREHDCTTCHDPSNSAGAKHLELLTYPNQALAGRHDLTTQIERLNMPPATVERPTMGIDDAAQRAQLVDLARAFAVAGDAALAFEGE